MKKKNIIIILLTILLIILIIFGSKKIINWLFNAQYNSNGISHFLVVTIDKNQQKELIGQLDNHRIYIENLNIKETNFRSVDAKNVSVKYAIDNKLTSLNEWKKYSYRIKKEGEVELLIFDNYEIACAYDDCIIRPISK